MSKAKMVLKETLKSLCCSNGWSYAVFWRFDQRNSMLLTMEDSYYEEQMKAVVDDMRLHVHMLGEGIVGQAASTGKHRWIFLDDANGRWNSASSVGSLDIFQDNCEMHRQFLYGMKTVAVISVESQGVVQFGSVQKILERLEFLDQMKTLFKEMENDGLTSSVNQPSSLNCDDYDLNELFASFCNGNITPMRGSSCNELMEMTYNSTNLTHLSSLTSDVQQERMVPLCSDLCHRTTQLHSASGESQVILQSAVSVDKSVAEVPCVSAWSSESSIVSSLESQLQFDIGAHLSPNLFSTKANTPASCGIEGQNFQGDSNLASLYSTGALTDVGKTVQKNSEQFKQHDFTTELSNSCIVDSHFEWFAPSPEFNISGIDPMMNENLLQSSITNAYACSGNALVDHPFEQPSISVQSSITETHACGGQEKSAVLHCVQHDPLEDLGLESRSGKTPDCWENMMMPALNGSHLATCNGISESVSEIDVGSIIVPRKGLFSELGLQKLLESISDSNYVDKFSSDDQLSTTMRRRVESSSFNGSQVQSFNAGSKTMTPTYDLEMRNNHLSKKERFPKSQVGLWIDDSYSINNGSNVQAKPRKPEEPTKTTRKRARPGESTRPRPKDRQQIQDRLKELKGIIPGGEKCSIDALLDRTIKHMLFLQSVTKYADKLKQANELKLTSQEKGMTLNDNNTSGSGATWALEVGDQTAICPIVIEDIGPPGLMRIEMICEDRGFFLEIADVIRGFGLNILKGMMELREDKIWARFVVEANTHMTRIEIFWSLVELIQRTTSSGMNPANQPHNVTNGRIPLSNNFQQPALPHAISLAETLQ